MPISDSIRSRRNTVASSCLPSATGQNRTCRPPCHNELKTLDALTWFGLFSVTAMLVCYALERRSRGTSWASQEHALCGSIYGFLQGAWPFGVVEAVWALVALRRWQQLADRA